MAAHRLALPLIALGSLSLILGIWSGLVRVGWPWPAPGADAWLAHGPLMVSGFLGTLISLERAVALEKRWGYAGPLLTAVGALVLLGTPSWIGPALILVGSAVLAALFSVILRRQPNPATAAMFLGAVAWVLGNLLWLASYPAFGVSAVVLWWMGFLVFVVAGERLELSRVLHLPRGAVVAFLLLADAFLVGAAWTAFRLDGGDLLAGMALLGLAAWLLRYDVARVQIRQRELSRFIASALLPGYVWLGVGGLLMVLRVVASLPLGYDAVLHAVFLGFVISMVFAHAPIIFPAVLGTPIAFRPWFYGHLLLLHAGLALRVAGDLLVSEDMRRWGALFNGIALLWFLVDTGLAAVIARREGHSAPA